MTCILCILAGNVLLYVGWLLDEFNEFCDRLETTAEWGGQAEVLYAFSQELIVPSDLLVL